MRTYSKLRVDLVVVDVVGHVLDLWIKFRRLARAAQICVFRHARGKGACSLEARWSGRAWESAGESCCCCERSFCGAAAGDASGRASEQVSCCQRRHGTCSKLWMSWVAEEEKRVLLLGLSDLSEKVQWFELSCLSLSLFCSVQTSDVKQSSPQTRGSER